jgi:hypothetical protein
MSILFNSKSAFANATPIAELEDKPDPTGILPLTKQSNPFNFYLINKVGDDRIQPKYKNSNLHFYSY